MPIDRNHTGPRMSQAAILDATRRHAQYRSTRHDDALATVSRDAKPVPGFVFACSNQHHHMIRICLTVTDIGEDDVSTLLAPCQLVWQEREFDRLRDVDSPHFFFFPARRRRRRAGENRGI